MLVSDLRHNEETSLQGKKSLTSQIHQCGCIKMNVLFGNNVLKWLLLESLTEIIPGNVSSKVCEECPNGNATFPFVKEWNFQL